MTIISIYPARIHRSLIRQSVIVDVVAVTVAVVNIDNVVTGPLCFTAKRAIQIADPTLDCTLHLCSLTVFSGPTEDNYGTRNTV